MAMIVILCVMNRPMGPGPRPRPKVVKNLEKGKQIKEKGKQIKEKEEEKGKLEERSANLAAKENVKELKKEENGKLFYILYKIMYKCKYCKIHIFPLRKFDTILTLKGKKININPQMYCSKDCFTMENIFTCKVFNYEKPYEKTYERSIHFSFDNYIKYN
jgi:hypothetical protein